MDKICAYINKTSYLVENMIMSNDASPYIPPDGYEVVEVPEGVPVTFGWAYLNGQFIEPPAPPTPPVQQLTGTTPNVIA
jgi:hypothetical protein